MRALAILSGKGGVGKSFISANLALALRKLGKKAGLLDLDFHGPSAPEMLGMEQQDLKTRNGKIVPATGPNGVPVVSIAFMTSPDSPIIWRGPLKSKAIQQLARDVDWGETELLVVDLPPGTGDEAISTSTEFKGAETLFITTPSKISKNVVLRAVSFARKVGLRPKGIVENMSGLFESDATETLAETTGLPIIARIPFDARAEEALEQKKPFILAYPDSGTSKEIMKVAKTLV